jgi:hypothetical protein
MIKPNRVRPDSYNEFIARKADAVLQLHTFMDKVFDKINTEANLRLAIMAGLNDAYERGLKDSHLIKTKNES